MILALIHDFVGNPVCSLVVCSSNMVEDRHGVLRQKLSSLQQNQSSLQNVYDNLSMCVVDNVSIAELNDWLAISSDS